jgi:glycerol-3-phosphate acyltransferase PlsX
MGGDYGPAVIVPAAALMTQEHPDLCVILVGQRDVIANELQTLRITESDRLKIHHASESVGMDEPPAQALRYKKDSSMRVAINLVKEGVADACVSAGNTGALMATAKFVLKTLPGVDRPAISALLPTVVPNKNVRVLDLGANVDSTAEQLFQFAVMGSVLAKTISNIENPKVALLNIGAEEIKGNEQVKEAAKLLSECSAINYIGNVEGDNIYTGIADVIICDGFVGNVALKTSEGLTKLILQLIKQAFMKNWLTKLSGLAAKRILKSVATHLEPARYNGASLVGLRGTVIKSHGSANVAAFANAIREAKLEVTQSVPDKIRKQVGNLLAH